MLQNKKIIITAGETFNDIDVLACAIAYKELLELEGKVAEVVLPGPLNNSITTTVKSWPIKFLTTPSTSNFDCVIVDISEPEYLARFATLESIVEIYDHHFGFEKFWQERLGEKSHIESIGACATLIWEQFKKRGLAEKISQLSANLLYTAILSNTLNFGAKITNNRDIEAFAELQKYINLPKNWQEIYFQEVEDGLNGNVKEVLINDTKTKVLPGINQKVQIGQLEIWRADKFLAENIIKIFETFKTFNNPCWFLNLVSIAESKNYIITDNSEVQKILAKYLNITFTDNIGTTDRLWLRKEIIKKIYQ